MSELIEVTQEDGNNYCKILTLLGMEEEGNPVAEVSRILTELAAANAKCSEYSRWHDALTSELSAAQAEIERLKQENAAQMIQLKMKPRPYADVEELIAERDKLLQERGGTVVVTTTEDGVAVAVTRQDEEGRILSVIWEAATHNGKATEDI